MILTRKQISKLIEIYGRDAKLHEVLSAHGFECPVCLGTGENVAEHDDPCERGGSLFLTRKCALCKGAGSTPTELRPKMVARQEGWE